MMPPSRFLALMLILAVGCSGPAEPPPNSSDPYQRLAEVRDDGPTGRFLPDPPLLGVQMTAGDYQGRTVAPAFAFRPSERQLTAVVTLGEVADRASLRVTWFRAEGFDDRRELFSHDISVGSFAHAYSQGLTPGRLAPGWYEVVASLGGRQVATRWRVVDDSQVLHTIQLVSSAAATNETEPGPPETGGSGVWVDFLDPKTGEWVPRHFDEFPWHLDPTTGEPWAPEEGAEPETREPQPCALEGIWGDYEFFFATADVMMGYDGDCDQDAIAGITIAAAIAGPPVVVGRGRRAEFMPCALPGGTDEPGTTIHVVAWLEGQEASSVATEIVIEDLEATVVGLNAEPEPGSRVQPGQVIALQALAMEMFQGPGIKLLEIRGPEGPLLTEEYEADDCDPDRHIKLIQTAYTVPPDPPGVIELQAVVEDHAGRRETDTIRFLTADTWKGTIESTTSRTYVTSDGFVGVCSDQWLTELVFTVDASGMVEGTATARLVSGPDCSFPMGAAPAQQLDFRVLGTAGDEAFVLRLEGGMTQAAVVAGLGTLYVTPGCPNSTPGAEIEIPHTAEGRARARVELDLPLGCGGSAGDTFTSTNLIELERAAVAE